MELLRLKTALSQVLAVHISLLGCCGAALPGLSAYAQEAPPKRVFVMRPEPTPAPVKCNLERIKQDFLRNQFTQLDSRAELSAEVFDALRFSDSMYLEEYLKLYPKAYIADPGEDWAAGCSQTADTPGRGLHFGGHSENLWFLYFGVGGIATSDVLQLLCEESPGRHIIYSCFFREPVKVNVSGLGRSKSIAELKERVSQYCTWSEPRAPITSQAHADECREKLKEVCPSGSISDKPGGWREYSDCTARMRIKLKECRFDQLK